MKTTTSSGYDKISVKLLQAARSSIVEPINYRPVSVISVVSEVQEDCLWIVNAIFGSTPNISKFQSVFRSNHSNERLLPHV